jgi:transposase
MLTGEGTGTKVSDNGEAPQRATALRLIPTHQGLCVRNDKAKRGYSRNQRPDCKQIVVGLVVNRDGFPIAHEVFAGNTRDHTTLATMLDRLSARAGLKKGATVVIDRGMAYDENIAELTKRNMHYVVASRQPKHDRWLADFEDTDGFSPVLRQGSPLNPTQKKSTIEVKTRDLRRAALRASP